MSKINFVIACGGTGGHLFPGLAVAEVLKDRGHEVLLFVSRKEIDRTALKDYPWLRSQSLPVVGMPPILSLGMIGFIKEFFSSVLQCLEIYKNNKPSCILAMGGFTAAPPVIAGWLKKIPSVVHDSNAIPGKANRFVARFVSVVALGLEACKSAFPHKKVEITGTPVRKLLRVQGGKNYATFGLDPEKKTILVMGGSQGASGINNAVVGLAGLFDESYKNQWQIVHLTGASESQKIINQYETLGVTAYVAPFSHQMGELYMITDLAISRSGAASITELSCFGIPALLIPFPFAAEDHQTKNAKIYEKAGAAKMIPQNEATPQRLLDEMNFIMQNHTRFSEQSRLLFIDEAEVKVANLMESLCR